MADFDNERTDRYPLGETDRQIARARVAGQVLQTARQSIGVINQWTMGRPCPVPNTPLAINQAQQVREPLPGLMADVEADLGAFEITP